MAKVGNFMGPLIYLLTIGIVLFGLGYVSYTKGYYMGREGIGKIIGSGLLNRVTEKATVLGGLTASYVTIQSGLKLHLSTGTLDVQNSSIRQHF